MKYKIVSTTVTELTDKELEAISEQIYSVLGVSPVGFHHYVKRMTDKSYINKTKDGVIQEITPLYSVAEFLMVSEYQIEWFQIRSIAKRQLKNYQIKLGW